MTVFLRHIFLLLTLVLPLGVSAFSIDTYTDASVLASGRWVKISVAETGLHLISNSDLKKWGFPDPEKVRVYGYGGRRIPDRLSKEQYIDDLPLLQSELTGRGIVFYAVGPESWQSTDDGKFVHSLNPYSTVGYYYLSDKDADTRIIPTEGGSDLEIEGLADSFVERLYHEVDRVTPAESGHQLLGEDFRFAPSRSFYFQLPGRKAGTDVWTQVVFFAKTVSSPGRLTLTANGVSIGDAGGNSVSGDSEYGDTCCIRTQFPLDGNTLTLGMRFSVNGTVSLAHLDNISVNYVRELSLPAERKLNFSSSSDGLKLLKGSESVSVWDVTSPQSIVRMRTIPVGDDIGWKNDYHGMRDYAVWDDNAKFPSPKYVGRVSNQNLHGKETPEMVIVTHPALFAQAERVSELHRSLDGMNVLTVTMDEVANEFGSGVADVNAIRKMLKMYHDRGSLVGAKDRLKYLLLFGSVTHDHRRLTEAMSQSKAATVPTWQSDMCISENDSYCSDDILAFLKDDSGKMNGSESMDIAVGRIPARDLGEAKSFVDRLTTYMTAPMSGEWRNRVLLLADDGDNGLHLKQTEQMEKAMRGSSSGGDFTYNKVYTDAYELQDGVYEGARDKMYRLLEEGVIWWNFVGHANLNSLTAEGVFTASDLNNLYLKYPTFFYGATCSFAQWDGAEESGMERLVMRNSGGAIGGISAVRKVLMSRNGVLTSALGEELFARADDGRFNTIGEVLRRAKNKVRDDNKLRYVLLGDPAMRLAVPVNRVVLESIDGVEVNEDTQVTLKAMQQPRFHGSVRDASGEKLTEFNGWMSVSLFDAERSVITKGNGADGKEDVYDEQGDRLFTGRAKVVNGEFDLPITIPSEIADNFRNAALSMYALSDDGEEAMGVNRDFYVCGYDPSADPDSVAPVIEYIYMDHESFKPGDITDSRPTLIARLSDNVGINMSVSGVGHQMSLRIDDNILLTDVASSYTPDDDGASAGVVRYKLPELLSGSHTATLKVWDVGGNSATASVDFYVDPYVAPKIFDVYTDANPVAVEAKFYVEHNRPDAMLNVKIEVFDMAGRRVWTSSTHGRADMYLTSPVTWDLTGNNGGKVPVGIYVYRVIVSGETASAGEPKASSMSKKLAVCSRK